MKETITNVTPGEEEPDSGMSFVNMILENRDYYKRYLSGHSFGNAVAKDDIINETIIRILIQAIRGNTRKIRHPKAYVKRIMHNVVVQYANELTKDGQKEHVYDDHSNLVHTINKRKVIALEDQLRKKIESDLADTQESILLVKYYTDAEALVELAKQRLKGNRREVFVLKVGKRMTLEAAARELGIEPNNAKQLYNRAKKDIREIVKEEQRKKDLNE